MTANSKLYYTLLAESEQLYAQYCAMRAAAARVSASEPAAKLDEEIKYLGYGQNARNTAKVWAGIAEQQP